MRIKKFKILLTTILIIVFLSLNISLALDQDNDGVDDENDECPDTVFEFVDTGGCPTEIPASQDLEEQDFIDFGLKPVYRFYNSKIGNHFYTINETEKRNVEENLLDYDFENVAFFAYDKQVSGAKPVIRYYNSIGGNHFYTMSDKEMATIVNNSDYVREGVAFYVFERNRTSNTKNVWRFYNDKIVDHFYTIDENEKISVENNLTDYRLEGVGFWAFSEVPSGEEEIINGDTVTTSSDRDDSGYVGYIVELQGNPLAVEYLNIDADAESNVQSSVSFLHSSIAAVEETLFNSCVFSTMPSNVDCKREKAQKEIEEEHEEFLDSSLSSITGNVVAGSETNDVVMNEFKNAFNGFALDISDEEADRLRSLDIVKEVYPNYIVKIELQDSVPIVRADKFWELDRNENRCSETGLPCLTGRGVKIGIIDSGVDYNHPDLGGCFGPGCKVIDGYDFVVCEEYLHPFSDVCVEEKSPDSDPMDNNGHGTHVAAIAAGNGVLKGVAPDANIVAYRTLNKIGRGETDWSMAAIERSIDPNGDQDFSDHLDIISMSFGATCLGGYDSGCGPDDPKSIAVDNAVNIGIIAVVSAGNAGNDPSKIGSNSGTIGSPGTSRKAITVGATDKNDNIAEFSSIGPVLDAVKPDLVAPGVDICAAQALQDTIWQRKLEQKGIDVHCIDENHIALSGTSMAAPHVAGATALLLQQHPEWRPEQIKKELKNGALNLGVSANSQGVGRLRLLDVIPNKEVFRLYNSKTGDHFYTISEDEKNNVLANIKDYSLEQSGFSAFDFKEPGTVAVHRFFDTVTGDHYYTINEDQVETLPMNSDYVHEFIAFHAYENTVNNTVPVYRFYNPTSGDHFYTASPNERKALQESDAYIEEGIEFYAIPTETISVNQGFESYPNQLIENGKFDGVLVIGDNASAKEVIAADDIAQSLRLSNKDVGTIRLASEIPDLNRNIISVGNSCSNAVSAELVRNPEDCLEGLNPGVGILRMFNDQGYTYVLVTGYEQEDIENAAEVLANYDDYELKGDYLDVTEVNGELVVMPHEENQDTSGQPFPKG